MLKNSMNYMYECVSPILIINYQDLSAYGSLFSEVRGV
jgi:hypothetical protein